MEDKRKCGCRRKAASDNKAVDACIDGYSGVEINVADENKVDKRLVKERTATLNNNPRNDEDFDEDA